jgi:CRP/FNR family transcriptional regulator
MTIGYTNESGYLRLTPIGPQPNTRITAKLLNRNDDQSQPIKRQPFRFPIGFDDHCCPRSNIAAIAQLERVGRSVPFPARAAVFHQGDPANSVYVVRQGRLKLSLVSRRGRCVVFRFAVAGDLLGFSAVLNQIDHEFLAQTLEPCVLVSVPRSEFLELLQESHEVIAFATHALARDHDAMLRGIRRLGMSASIRERLAQLLLNCLELPRTDGLPMSIRINWTYGELADMVNSSRETVTRVMSQFEREELIARHGSLVVIRNTARLKLLAS